MDDLGLYFVFLIPPLLFGLGVQWWLKKTVARNKAVAVTSGMSGAQVAREILDRNGLTDVPVHRSPGGPLSDHYDPGKRAVFLSEPVHDGVDVTGTAVAAHEVGHAIQHAKAYAPMRLRSAMFPAVAFASSFWALIFVLIMVFMGPMMRMMMRGKPNPWWKYERMESGSREEIRRLEGSLAERDLMLEDLQHRMSELESRLDFTERLLAERRASEELQAG